MKTRYNQANTHTTKPRVNDKTRHNTAKPSDPRVKRVFSKSIDSANINHHHSQHGYNLRSKRSRNHSSRLFSAMTQSEHAEILPASMPELPVIDQLSLITTQLQQENPITLKNRLLLLQVKAEEDNNNPRSQFTAKVSAILLRFLSMSKNDCIYDILKSFNPRIEIIHTINSYLNIIDNVLNYMLKNLTAVQNYENKTDLLLYRAFKLLQIISDIAYQNSSDINIKLKNLTAKIIVRILVARSKDLSIIMTSLFSFNTGNGFKKIIIDSLSESLKNHDEHTKELSFTPDDLAAAFSEWSRSLTRGHLNIESIECDSGSYGNVYHAHDRNQPSRCVAIKFFKKLSTISSSKYGLTFLQQSKHPNIVSFNYLIERGDQTGIVMEFANYGSLSYYMQTTLKRDFRFPTLATQINKGLAYIHQAGYTHNDLKPGNILVLSNGDQRIAKITDVDTLRPIGSIRKRNCCTLAYSSPEDHTVGTIYQPSSDIYSFGGVLFYMKTLKHPHDNKGIDVKMSRTELPISIKIKQGITENPDDYTMPANVASLIKWCWKRHPDERPTHENITHCLTELTNSSIKM